MLPIAVVSAAGVSAPARVASPPAAVSRVAGAFLGWKRRGTCRKSTKQSQKPQGGNTALPVL